MPCTRRGRKSRTTRSCSRRTAGRCSVLDLVGNAETDELHLIPAEYQEDPDEARASITRLLSLPFQVLCLDHGTPIVTEPKRALEAVLAGAAAHTPA